MKIHQREKTLDYILKHLDDDTLHFLKYAEVETQGGRIIGGFLSLPVMDLTILDMEELINNDNAMLVSLFIKKI